MWPGHKLIRGSMRGDRDMSPKAILRMVGVNPRPLEVVGVGGGGCFMMCQGLLLGASIGN